MTSQEVLERISAQDVLDRHLDALVARDARLVPVRELAGEVPLRLREGGFAGMAAIVTSQLLSVASADAIHGRFEAILGEVTAERFLELEEAEIRSSGLSGGKYRTLKGLAEAELAGALDYAGLGGVPAAAAITALTELKGVGPWTAEIYLLFCTGHPDIFPAGDLALRKMVGHALGQKELPGEGEVRAIAEAWAPWRGAAARLMWRSFAVLKQKEGISL